MSKKIIAGLGVVAGLAVALAPVATFADDNVASHTDKLRLTVPSVCTLGTVTNNLPDAGTDSTTHTGDTWTNGTGADAASGQAGRTDTFAKDVAPGTNYAAIATSTFTIHCNDATGYHLKAAGPANGNLTTGTYNIPTAVRNELNLNADDNSYWNFYVSAVSNAYVASTNEAGQTIAADYDSAHTVPTSETTIVTGNGNMSVQTAETITVTYNAGIDIMQEAGTYEGSVVYTLVER